MSKRYETQVAVRDLDLRVADGEFLTLLGPSGCGKTTTLRMIAGFIAPTTGTIRVGDRVVSEGGRIVVPPEKRELGMVFQSYAVWPHMTVLENVAYPLKVHGVGRDERRERATAVLAQVKLDGLEARYPHQLSGGQQQRVALGRALVTRPQALLLDEPLSNLDAKLREEMRVELKDLQRATGATIVFVTHDQIEAMTLSDRVVLMEAGAVRQIGTPRDLYERPADRFVASFVGAANLLPATVRDSLADVAGVTGLRLAVPPGTPAGDALVMIRPEHLRLIAPGPQPRGRITRRLYEGDALISFLSVGTHELRAKVAADTPFADGDEVSFEIDHYHFVPS